MSFAVDAPPPTPEQVRDLLLRMLREMQPDFVEHIPVLSEHARATALQLGLTGAAVDEVTYAAELHDIGKLAIPETMLTKPSALDEEEWALMRRHTVIGERMLAAAPGLRPVAAIVRSSHERWDGEGYPDGLSGDRIPIGARIVAVCDAFAAMTSPRAYRPTIPQPVALAELARCAGKQFDPTVVDAFIATLAHPGGV
jgi:HD-GYP domain-containing protein (c-di-GMP phosphodiesterase class II)